MRLKVGNMAAIKKMYSEVRSTTRNAMETCRDLYEQADDPLTDQEIQGKVSGYYFVSSFLYSATVALFQN